MKTKSFQHIAILGVICILTFAGCQKDDILSVDTKEIILSSDIKKVTFNLNADNNGEWRIKWIMDLEPEETHLSQDWFEIRPNGGIGDAHITVSLIEESIPEKDRFGMMLVRKGEKEILIPIKFKKQVFSQMTDDGH